MKYLKNIGLPNFFMLLLCALIIIVAEYLFLKGEHLHGIFVGLWAPTVLGIMNFIKLYSNGGK